MSSNVVLEVCMPLFQLASSLTKIEDFGEEKTSVTVLRVKVLDAFERARMRALSLGINDVLWRDIQFVMAAFLDELILNDQQPEWHEIWSQESLQWIFFKEHLAGETFFERLSNVMRYPHIQLPLIELYYWCLMLGYKGKYHHNQQDQDELDHIRTSIKKVLERYHVRHNNPYEFQNSGSLNINSNFLQRCRFWRNTKLVFGLSILMIVLGFSVTSRLIQAKAKRLEHFLIDVALMR